MLQRKKAGDRRRVDPTRADFTAGRPCRPAANGQRSVIGMFADAPRGLAPLRGLRVWIVEDAKQNQRVAEVALTKFSSSSSSPIRPRHQRVAESRQRVEYRSTVSGKPSISEPGAVRGEMSPPAPRDDWPAARCRSRAPLSGRAFPTSARGPLENIPRHARPPRDMAICIFCALALSKNSRLSALQLQPTAPRRHDRQRRRTDIAARGPIAPRSEHARRRATTKPRRRPGRGKTH